MLHTWVMIRILSVVFVAAVATGCYATTTTGYTPAYVGPTVAVTATTVAPDLVYVSPGVQVIADFDEPIFYADGFYWREYNGTWYHSRYHTHGWVYAAPPRTIIGIRNRGAYRHYRPTGWSPRYDRGYNRGPVIRDNRGYNRPYNARTYNRPVVRDNRGYNRPAVRDNRSYNRPAVRDNRSNDRSNDRVRDNRRRR